MTACVLHDRGILLYKESQLAFHVQLLHACTRFACSEILPTKLA